MLADLAVLSADIFTVPPPSSCRRHSRASSRCSAAASFTKQEPCVDRLRLISRSFLDQLRRDRELVEISAPVDAKLEAAEIHRRVIAAGGPALLFTNVKGADFPLVTNLFGTARRAELAFGTRPLAFIKRLVHLAETLLPPTPAKLWGARDIGLICSRSARSGSPPARCAKWSRRTSGSIACRC